MDLFLSLRKIMITHFFTMLFFFFVFSTFIYDLIVKNKSRSKLRSRKDVV